MQINGIKINGIEADEAKLNGSIVYKRVREIIETSFTSRPFPSSWAEVTTGKEYRATNSYGDWRIWADNYTSGNPVSYAFDASYSTMWYSADHSNSTTAYNIGIDLPEGVTIRPEYVRIWSYGHNASSKLLGLNAETGEWDTLLTLANSNDTTNKKDVTLSVSSFYSKFKMQLYRYSSTSKTNKVKMFEIQSGTLRQEI